MGIKSRVGDESTPPPLIRLRGIVRLLIHGHLAAAAHRVANALWSNAVSVRLERDLRIPFAAPDSTIPIRIRPFEDADRSALLDGGARNLSSAELGHRERRARLVDACLPTAYVAITASGAPCYVQWLVGSDQNDRIHQVWNGEFPILAADEALLEGAMTPQAYRGRHIMPAAMARIAEKATALGARRVITFVADDNVPSLKGCARAGFAPVSARHLRRRLFRTIVEPMVVPATVDQYF